MMKLEERYDSLFQFYGESYEQDWKNLKAQGMAESNLNPVARSRVGAMGLMQFMPATFDEWATRLHLHHPDAFNPEHSIHCASAYMAALLSRYGANYDNAWSAYNWGMGNVDKWLTGEIASRPLETREYVSRIKIYRSKLA